MSAGNREKLQKAISYFTNQKARMRYDALVPEALPIGSGVTEAACCCDVDAAAALAAAASEVLPAAYPTAPPRRRVRRCLP